MGMHQDSLEEIVLEVDGPARAQLALLGDPPCPSSCRGWFAVEQAVRLDFHIAEWIDKSLSLL
jgi:hypothetical protein